MGSRYRPLSARGSAGPVIATFFALLSVGLLVLGSFSLTAEHPRPLAPGASPLPASTLAGPSLAARPTASATAAPVPAPSGFAPVLPGATITVVSAVAVPAAGSQPLVATLTAQAHGSSTVTNFTFLWLFGDGTPNLTVVVPVATAGANGTDSVTHTYYVATGSNFSFYNATVNVTDNVGDRYQLSHKIPLIVTMPLLLTAVATPSVFTIGRNVTLTPVVSGGLTPYRYTWSGTPAGCVTGVVVLTCNVTASGTYSIRVTVNDAAANHNTTAATFTANPKVVVFAGNQGFFSCPAGLGILQENFSANVTGGTPPYAYSWSFGDGAPTVNGTRVVHNYTTAGNFTAQLNVTDSGGGNGSVALKISALFAACNGVPPPSFSFPTTLVKGLIVLVFLVVIVLTLLIFFRRRRESGRAPVSGWNKRLEPPTSAAAPRAAKPAPARAPEPPPPDEGTVQ